MRAFTCSIYKCNSNSEDKLEKNLIQLVYDYTNNTYQELKNKFNIENQFVDFITQINEIVKNIFVITSHVLPSEDDNYINKVNQTICEIFISDNIDKYAELFTKNIEKDETYDIIEKIYEISKNSLKLKENLLLIFKNYVASRLEHVLVTNVCKPKNLCLLFSDKISHYQKIISTALKEDQEFVQKLDSAISFSIHKIECDPNFLTTMTYYLDHILFRSPKPPAENLFSYQIGVILKIYSFLSSKETFNKKFLYFICKRVIEKDLLNNTESALLHIYEAFSSDFFTSLFRIFEDFKISQELNSKYRKNIHKYLKPAFSIALHAVRSELWPLDVDNSIEFPSFLQIQHENFEKFYKSEFPNRKLTFIAKDSYGEINFTICSKTYKLRLNAYQLTIFNLFNDLDSVHLDEITQKTKICSSLIKDYLVSFVESDILRVNDSFYELNLKFKSTRKCILLDKLDPKLVAIIIPEANLVKKINQLSEDSQQTAIKCLVMNAVKIHGEIDFKGIMNHLKISNKYGLDLQDHTIRPRLQELIEREFILTKSDNPNLNQNEQLYQSK
ncbi:hypothetical protein HZS_4412 [Henneguya salminicola]|nr:hypothetical protein HZS_4412 [Henneguya salminicola]